MKSLFATILFTLVMCMTSSAGAYKEHKTTPGAKHYTPLPVLAQNQEDPDLEFLKTEAKKSKDGKKFHVKGIVKNISTSNALKKVTVTVIIYDKNNKELDKKTVSTSPDVIKPGEEAAFEVVTKYYKEMHGYQKTAKWRKRRW